MLTTACAGEHLGVFFVGDEELNVEALAARAREGEQASLQMPLQESDDFVTYTLTSANATFLRALVHARASAPRPAGAVGCRGRRSPSSRCA